MSDFHALSGAYAIDALDEVERARFERHLAECSECRAEVDSLRAASAFLAETAEAPAPTELRDRVLAGISQVRPLPPVVPEPAARSARRTWLPRLAAAAAVLVVLGAGGYVLNQQPWRDGTSQSITLADRIINAPDVKQLHDDLANGGQVTIFRSVSEGRAVITASDMPAPPRGHVYQLWLQDTHGEMVSAGVMGSRPTVLEGDAAHAIGAGITVEPSGGSKAPTTQPIVLFHFKAAT